MDAWSVIVNGASRLPWEKWLFRRPDPQVRLERLREALTTKPHDSVVYNPSAPESLQAISLPTTQETVTELKRRLAKELYRMELDLTGGGRIAGRPCDCLGQKHHLGLEATVEELIPMDSNPTYSHIISWLNTHGSEFEPEEVAKRPPEYYRGLAPEVRRFRKEVMGTEATSAMLSSEERTRVMERATQILHERIEGIDQAEGDTNE